MNEGPSDGGGSFVFLIRVIYACPKGFPLRGSWLAAGQTDEVEKQHPLRMFNFV